MKKSILITGVIIITLFVLGFFLFEEDFSEEVFSDEIVYVIDNGESVEKYTLKIEGSTVFSLFKELDIKTTETWHNKYGVFIESIGGVENGIDNKYWQYWVNGKLGEVAANEKNVRGGDKVEWKFEEPF